MAVYTPRGLKIRFDMAYAFALMQRLYPKVKAIRVLKMAEGYEMITPALTFITALITFNLRLTAVECFQWILLSAIPGTAITYFGLYWMPLFRTLGWLYSFASGLGLYLLFILIVGYQTGGWPLILSFAMAKTLIWFFQYGIDFYAAQKSFIKRGIPLHASELNFINAYRLFAMKQKKSANIEVKDDDLDSRYWLACYQDLYRDFPHLASRFY